MCRDAVGCLWLESGGILYPFTVIIHGTAPWVGRHSCTTVPGTYPVLALYRYNYTSSRAEHPRFHYCSKTPGGADTYTQNADRGRATPHSGTNPHTGQNRGQDTPGSDQEQNGRDNTAQKQPRDPTNRRKNHKQPAPRPPAPRPGQLSQKGRDPCRQRDLRPHQTVLVSDTVLNTCIPYLVPRTGTGIKYRYYPYRYHKAYCKAVGPTSRGCAAYVRTYPLFERERPRTASECLRKVGQSHSLNGDESL